MNNIDTLIILPCHSIWKDGPSLGENRAEWHLASFQLEGYDHLCFKEHITKSVELLEHDTSSLLVISGGQTKVECPNISESLSYFNLLLKLNRNCELIDRITTEEFARDSLENVIFLICRYYEMLNRYPKKIKIVGFKFKRERFLKHHLIEALKISSSDIEYIGNSPNPKDLDQEGRELYFKSLEESEYEFAVKHFRSDYYGLDSFLAKKKLLRNPFNRSHGYIQSNPKLSGFLTAISDGTCSTSVDAHKLLDDFWNSKY